MQRSPEDHTECSPVVMSAAEHQQDTEAQPTPSKPVDQEGKDKPDAPAQTTTTPTSMSLTPPLDKEPGVQSQAESRENAGKAGTDPTAKPSAPPGPAAESDGQGVKKQGKGSGDGRRYVSSRNAMISDMSESEVVDLTCEYFTYLFTTHLWSRELKRLKILTHGKLLNLLCYFFAASQLSLHCIECHIIFSDLKGKERHMKHSHPAEYEQCILRNSLFACYVCDRHFTNSTELMAHQKAHPDKKPFKCPICSQSFKKSSELTAHKKIHFGQDGYACKDCGKTCKTLTLLKYHQRKHSGETPYVCKDCGKRFPLSKALQKHIDSHSLEGAEVDTVSTAASKNKADGASRRVYICSVCKATFKSLRTRQQHLITKHKFDAITNPFRAGLQNTPLISPISISQPALLQVEPNGPLQKVDANIDTEQIRKLIESLGNVQKVNKVVILGQVPPNAPPLQVQQVSEPAAMFDLNLGPPQTDFTGLKPAGSKTLQLDTLVSPMDQTIILEPITPEGQLETPSFSELGSHVAAEERVELTLIPAEQTERLKEAAVHQNFQRPEISPMNYDPSVCQNEVADLKENLEQTFILELTPALMPAAELEQSQSEPQNGIISSSLVQSTEQETPDPAPDDIVEDAKKTKIPVPPLTPTVELELTSTHPEEQDLSSCPSAPPETIIQAPSESEAKENTDSDTEKVGLDQIPAINEKTTEKDKQDVCEKFPAEDKSSLSTDPQVVALSKLETEGDQQKSELPVSVMSAQELVKVRKRKPARTFFFQGYMHDLVGSIYRDDFQIDAKPAKRQRTKKSCLVVKFGPQGKDKKSKKQKKPEQEQTQTQDNLIKSKTSPKKLPEKVQKVQTQKKTGKGKKEKTENTSSGSDTKSSSTHTPQVKQVKDDAKKNKMKKQKETKEDVVHISKQKPVAMLKKKKAAKILQKDQPKNPKEVKGKKNLTKAQKVQKAEATDSNINQDSLLLLKGHKQPQLKVYKLDTLKASGPTQEDSPHDSQSSDISKAGGKKKGTRTQKNQKGLSLLSSLQASRQQPQIVPTKPKTTRKRKASLNVETEGVITSKRALECKDCGEKFSEVASLQKHKTTAHIIESPGLTYTNGNIFEGVSGFDLYRLPKENSGVVRVMNAPTDWDTETEMGEMTLEDRDRGVSFPALIPSPSLQIPAHDGEMGIHEHNGDSKTEIEDHFCTSSEFQSSSDEPNNTETQSNVTTEASFPPSTEPKGSNTEEPAAPEEDTQEDLRKNLNFQAKVQGIADEDIKEDLLLEVDLVTVGEQEEKDDADSQNESNRVYKSNCEITNHKQVGNETREYSLTCQTVSCSTHQPEVKEEEEEETLVSRRKEAVKEVVTGQSRRGELLKSDLISKTSSGLEQEHEPGECWIVYEKQLLHSDLETADQEISTKTQPSPGMKTIKDTPPAASLPSVHATVEESSEEAAAFELRPLTTGVDEVMNQRRLQGEKERESDQSPGIILERVISSKQGPTTDREMSSFRRIVYVCQEQALYNRQKNNHLFFFFSLFLSRSFPNSASHLQAPHDDNRTEKPVDYFSEYFSWDTWVEIASCTNKLSKMPNPVTCREVARFVGIHIAMGTLKFPSARLYWEDLTKVSLIAEAMPLNRFLDLSRMLKLCSLNEPKANVTDADPLWKVRPLLYRFNEGCQSLKQPGDYAIDQYPVSLTGKIHNNRPSLQCTTLIGLNGLITHLDLELHPAENQDAVENMVPKGSTLFLCKQELSTPAMLERLLAAGIHGAGRVEGARGHIGDEFVSSDGKLMLRRTHCGFILSTAGNSQRNMVSLIDGFEKAQTSARLSSNLLNLYSTPLTVSLPTCWPQAVLWHLTDAALVNSWLQYRQDYRAASAPMTFMAFRLEVSKALILSSGLDTQDSIPPQPPEEDAHHPTSEAPSPGLLEESPLPDLTTRYDGTGHWPEQLAEGEGGRCRFGDCQRTSRVLCLKCCVFLCISRNHNCFLNFHNQESSGEEQ
uniref:Uncharacterized LOC103478462 n=1 Tax=Poecilia reticulata TaxID=8081 RepID=A0A3P9NQ32_POERE